MEKKNAVLNICNVIIRLVSIYCVLNLRDIHVQIGFGQNLEFGTSYLNALFLETMKLFAKTSVEQ